MKYILFVLNLVLHLQVSQLFTSPLYFSLWKYCLFMEFNVLVIPFYQIFLSIMCEKYLRYFLC